MQSIGFGLSFSFFFIFFLFLKIGISGFLFIDLNIRYQDRIRNIILGSNFIYYAKNLLKYLTNNM